MRTSGFAARRRTRVLPESRIGLVSQMGFVGNRRFRAAQLNISFHSASRNLVEVWGLEPQTFSLRTRRSTN